MEFDLSILAYIVWAIVFGVIVYYSFKKEKREHDKYFGKKLEPTKKEKKLLEKYKLEYQPIKADKRLPSIRKDGFKLEDIAKSATEMIYDNPLPAIEEKKALKKGDFVKLKFVDKDHDVERMWVEIVDREEVLFKGILGNDSFYDGDLSEAKIIWFHPNHIFQIEK